MPSCKKCGDVFPNRTTINGKVRTLNSRKYCLKCSPFGLNNRRSLEKPTGSSSQICRECGKSYTRKTTHGTQAVCWACRSRKIRSSRKDKCVEYKGGRCSVCGYNRCDSAMEFHHTDANEKDFSIGNSMYLSWHTIKLELDKCILVCANCHREIHAGIISANDEVGT